jgi:IS1 family transposase
VASPRAVRLGRLEVAAAERGRFVKRQATKPWVGSAMDKQTRPSMACHVGERSHASAQQVWANLPVVDRERATFYTEQ